MPLVFASFLAGMLTVLAPCILPLLPVIVGGTLTRGDSNKKHFSWRRPLTIALGLAISVIVFSLLLKATTALLGIPPSVWQIISGLIVIGFGVIMLKPSLWESVNLHLGLQERSNRLNSKFIFKKGTAGDFLLGASLGPIFNSCSPTYALIIAAILPKSFLEGFIYLIAYAAGLALMLLLIAAFGVRITSRLGWANKPGGTFSKIIGLVFIAVGLLVITGLDKDTQTFILNQSWYDPIYQLDSKLMI